MKARLIIISKRLLLVILFQASLALAAGQDSITVQGLIVSHTNDPVRNVSVSVEGSFSLPVITDENGFFSIKVSKGNVWLIIAPSGSYKTRRVYLSNRVNPKIILSPLDINAGDDMISILGQEIRRRNITSSFSDADVRNMKHASAMSIDEYLSGRVAGLAVTNRSGMPGSGAQLSIRGMNSLHASNQALVIVDGIPLASQDLFESNLEGYAYNPLMSINPYDVSSAVVIKDPAITAAYGSKASNGVIYISTLDPSVTQTSIDIDYRSGISLTPKQQIPVLNADQHRNYMSELLFSSPWVEEEIVEYYPNLFYTEEDDKWINYQHNTNWQDLIFENSFYNNFNMSVKGGDQIARYGLSFGYTDGKGILRNTGYKGYNLRFVSLLNIFTWLKMDAGVALNNTSAELKPAATSRETSPILTSLSKSPMLNPYQYDFSNYMLTTLAEVDELGVSNPLATIENLEANNKNYNFTATLGFTGEINKNLHLKTNLSLNYNVLKEAIFKPNKGMELYYNNEAINIAILTNNSITSIYNNTYLTYNKTINDDHRITSNTGINLQSNDFEFDWGLTKNAHENDEYRMIQDGQNNLRESGGANRDWNWISIYEYATYSYKDKYLASATLSLDGSSRVGAAAENTLNIGGSPFGVFYGGGLAWRISNESFLSNLSWIEELKLRVSAGKSGNDDIGEASAINYYLPVKYRETVGLYPGTVPNPELTYETVSQFNAGMDLALTGSKFAFSVDLYKKSTDNMIIYSPIETYLGFDLRTENGGKMETSGIELSAFYRIVDKGDFKWDLSGNFATCSNQVTEIVGDKLSYSIPGGERVNIVGEAANSFFGYIYEGVYATQQDADAAALINDRNIPFSAGDAIYRDISGPNGRPDSVINDYDKTTIGSSMPRFYGGILNTFSYKRFSLNVAIQFVYGNKIFNYLRYENEKMSTLQNQSTTVLNRWQFEGHDTEVPRALWDDPLGNSDFSTRWIEDGSYARLKLITLSYKVPRRFLAFRNAEFYVSLNNILTLSNYLGYDPEFAYSYSHKFQGVDYGQTPQARQFMAGIKLGL